MDICPCDQLLALKDKTSKDLISFKYLKDAVHKNCNFSWQVFFYELLRANVKRVCVRMGCSVFRGIVDEKECC